MMKTGSREDQLVVTGADAGSLAGRQEGARMLAGSGEVLQHLPQLDEAQAGRRRTIEQHHHVAAQGHGQRGALGALEEEVGVEQPAHRRLAAASRQLADDAGQEQGCPVRHALDLDRKVVDREPAAPGIVEGEPGQADIGPELGQKPVQAASHTILRAKHPPTGKVLSPSDRGQRERAAPFTGPEYA